MAELRIIEDRSPPSARRSRFVSLRVWSLRLYRLVVLVTIIWLLHLQQVRLRVQGDAPIRLEELTQADPYNFVSLKPIFPNAARLEPDSSSRGGMFVLDAGGGVLGYVVRTSPIADAIKGYSGRTDTLVALDRDGKVVAVRIRDSQDTRKHAGDVARDKYFIEDWWIGKTWDEVATINPKTYRKKIRVGNREVELPMEGVSGSTLTSIAMAQGIYQRFADPLNPAPPQPLRIGVHDVLLVVVMAVAILFAFTDLRGRPWLRRSFQAVLIGYVGIINGQILAQSLWGGWAANGVAWRMAPALVLLTAVALIVPWATRRQLYCSHICPHGAAQEWAGRLSRWRLHVPKPLDRGLRWTPFLIIALVLVVVMLKAPFDLAGIEPFDAYILARGGWAAILATTAAIATVALAIIGLIVSAFVPMAYCKYGCPTGAILQFVRSHGKADGIGRREIAAGVLVALCAALYIWYEPLHAWLMAGRSIG